MKHFGRLPLVGILALALPLSACEMRRGETQPPAVGTAPQDMGTSPGTDMELGGTMGTEPVTGGPLGTTTETTPDASSFPRSTTDHSAAGTSPQGGTTEGTASTEGATEQTEGTASTEGSTEQTEDETRHGGQLGTGATGAAGAGAAGTSPGGQGGEAATTGPGGEGGQWETTRTDESTRNAHVAFEARSDSNVTGTLVVHHREQGGLEIRGNVHGLPPNSRHGFHIHEVGDCSAPDASSAGEHFNPDGAQHGGMRTEGQHTHAGALGNIQSNADGIANIDIVAPHLALTGPREGQGGTGFNVAELAMVVHANEDDLQSQPSGNSGARIACGIIEPRGDAD